MRIFESISEFQKSGDGLTILIGKADALHLGHIALINETLKLSEELKSKSGILSLVPVPSNPIFDSESLRFILTEKERRAFLSNWPLDFLIIQKMNADFTNLTAKDFVSKILIDKLGVRGVVVGWDFRFGSSREGDTEILFKLSKDLNFELKTIEPVFVDGKPVKTTQIKKLLIAGKVHEAWKLLGYPFYVTGKVAKGKGVGQKLGYPTANILLPSEKMLPRKGVYIGRGLFDDTCKWGLINVGTRPTIGQSEDLIVEIWFKDFVGEIYSHELKIEFFEFVRDEIRFSSTDELKMQINHDLKDLEDFLLQ